jgi:hypothetical protein
VRRKEVDELSWFGIGREGEGAEEEKGGEETDVRDSLRSVLGEVVRLALHGPYR